MAKSKSLKAIQGTIRPDRDITPKESTVDRSEFPDPVIELNESARHFYDLTVDHLNEASVLYSVDAMLLSVLAKNIDIMIQASPSCCCVLWVWQKFWHGLAAVRSCNGESLDFIPCWVFVVPSGRAKSIEWHPS